MKRNREHKDTEKLIKGYGFTPFKAFKLLLFSVLFSSIGICVFIAYMNYSFMQAKNEVRSRLLNTFELISSVYDRDSPSEYLEGIDIVKKHRLKRVGPKDLSLNPQHRLILVKGQKREIADGVFELRFIKK